LLYLAFLGIDASYLDPQHNFDFTNVSDQQDGKTFFKGGERYFRPCGWKRFALNVKANKQTNKFPYSIDVLK
jgi:hypothetical protein